MVSRPATLTQREKPYDRNIKPSGDSGDEFRIENHALNKSKKRISVARKSVNKSKTNKKSFMTHNNKENIKPSCNIATLLDSEDECESLQETSRKTKKNRVSGCDIRLHQIIKNKKSSKTKGIRASEKIITPIIDVEQPTTSGEAANIANISPPTNADDTQQPIFGERSLDDVYAFVDEQLWLRKEEVHKELMDKKMQEFTNRISTSMGDNTVLDLLDINMDHFEEMVGGASTTQNNEAAPEPLIIQIDNTQQDLHINDGRNTVEAVRITNNQTEQHQYSTIDMALFHEMMAHANPIEPPAINQIMQPLIQAVTNDNIQKPIPLGQKKQSEECLGANDKDFASPIKSNEKPYIVYRDLIKKSPIVGGQRTLKRLQRASDNRQIDNIKKFNLCAENRWYEEVFKMGLESISRDQNTQGLLIPEARKTIKSGMLYSRISLMHNF